jgi:CHAT domain-containing protein/Tfp pilus assembly protein PilF
MLNERVGESMRTRIELLIALVVASVCLGGAQQPRSPAQTLQEQLRIVEQAIEQRQYREALQRIGALQQRDAHRRMSRLEQAYLTHLRARTLHRLRREDLHKECIALWEQSRRTYQELGNPPLELEATLSLAFCYWQSDRARAEQLLEEVWQRLRTEQDISLELAQALSFCAEDWFEAKEWAMCQRLLERALTMRQALEADETLLARTRYNLGVVALRQNQLDAAQIYLRAALNSQEQLLPNTPALAATLKALGELIYRRGNLEEAERFYQRALQIYAQSGEGTLEHAQTLIGLGTIALRQQRWDDARNFYERAQQIAESVAPESREAGQAYLGLGTVALETDRLQDAEQWLLKAAQNPNLEPSEQIQASHELGRLALRRGDFKTATGKFTRALERQRALSDTPLNIARTLYNLGVCALERGEVAQAREFCRQSLEIRQQENAQPVAVAHTLVALGFAEFYSRDFVQARRYFDQALAAYDAANAEPLGRSRAWMGLGFVATELGAFSEAETHLQNALQAQLKHNARKTALHAQTLIGLGNLALRQGALDAAFRYYTQAHALVQELPTPPLLKVQSLSGLGNLALRQRDLQRAESYYAQAQQILDQFAPESPLAVQIRLNRGALALELGDAERAAAIFTNARAAAERLAQAELLARVNLSAAIAAIRAKRIEAAREPLQQAVAALQRPGGNPLLLAHALYYRGVASMRAGAGDSARSDFEAALQRYQQLAPNSLFVALAELNLAKLDYRGGDAPQARERLQRAIQIIEQQRSFIPDPESQVAFSEDYYAAYSLLALLEAERGQYARAVELLEQSRARTLVEQIQRNRVEFADTSPALAELLRQQQRLEAQRLELRRQISQLYALVESPPDESLRKSPEDAEREARPLYDALATLERELQQLEAELRTRFPEVARLLAPPQLTLALIQQQLEPDVALIYHALVENNLLILVVTRQGVQAHYGAVNAERLTRAVERFREAIQQRNHSRVVELGAWLYETLIVPVATALTGYERVLLCSEGVLNLLPWAALVAEVRNNQPTYWVERVALHTTPSLGVYRYARLTEPASQGVLIVAVSQYAADAREEIALQRRALGNLAYVSQEVANLERLFLGASVLREEAVQPDVVRERARMARIVHFACHADADSDAPLNSRLLFGTDENRQLTAAQILAQWRLQADLVMLSACETGTGKAYRYEGVMGLARAFLSVGAKTVGATLWQVDDEKTAQLVSAFYTAYVNDKLPKDRALQKVQHAMARNNEPPYYWAGFILAGDCR